MTFPQQHQMPSADEFLMGGGVPSAKFPTIGTTVAGRITERPTVEQQRDYTTGELKFWDDGKPQMQLVVTVQTDQRDPSVEDDDGTRRLYIKGQMKTAVAQAVRAAGARGLEVGGILSVTYARDGERKNPRFNAPKNFTAVYTPAAQAELHAPEPGAQPQGQPVAAQQAAPMAQQPGQGLTPQQYAQAQQNPATAALLAQQQAAAQGNVPQF
ncbi:hypothetical protein [Streptomyces macrosporus]|uniref:Single-stranded DNA-binding protein n=1 Tax=Streptomyces macrosporus TaxID=44032 RepID=A0ABN3KEN3_9ACTN